MLRNFSVLEEVIGSYRECFVANSLIDELSSMILADNSARINMLEDDIRSDREALIVRDPANREVPDAIISPNSPFMSVASYRIGHWLWETSDPRDQPGCRKKRLAIALQHAARALTGIDIHPAATIGSRFIIDHGYGVVIGQTAVIGEDCYVLNGVTIGARGIADNPRGKRHPTIGNRVEIGAFARLLGPIEIGDDVFIGPLALVTKDIPSNTRVTQRQYAPERQPPAFQSAPFSVYSNATQENGVHEVVL